MAEPTQPSTPAKRDRGIPGVHCNHVNGREHGRKIHHSQNWYKGVIRVKRPGEPSEDLPVTVTVADLRP